MNKLFFSHRFGFHNGYSKNHALTSLTEMIRKALDKEKFTSGVDHGILLSKLNHYDTREASYKWFKSSLISRQ